ncbi:hypothetical protein [Microbacterium sp.]|uniref:hypothetical protein n=1 Tax=Microbacterium sp. TaxID=51671 RepID=UPI003A86777C
MTDETHNSDEAEDALAPVDGDEPDEVTAAAGDDADSEDDTEGGDPFGFDDIPAPPRPVNWRTLSSSDAEHEWLTLNEWVNWLRLEFGLPAAVIPPFWHRHPELVWELSALHLRWLGCYDPQQDAAGPLAFLTDFHAAQQRLREWVSISGTRLDRDRPTRLTSWPGEEPASETTEQPITDRDEDFVAFVIEDVTRRAEAEAAFLRAGEEHS